MIRLLSVILFFCFLLSAQLCAQTKLQQVTDSLVAKIEWYSAKKKPSLLYVHFDKNIYTGSEQVWFTAYLVASKNVGNEHNTLVVALIRNDDSVLVANEKFVMMNDLSFGNLTLPDTLAPGNYSFYAYTNVLSAEKPVADFIQPITIKAVKEPTFTASLKLAEKILPGNDSVKLSFKAFAKDIHTIASATEVSYTLGKQKQKFKTDVYGDASFKVSLKGLDPSNNIIKLNARFNEEKKALQLALPVNNYPTVKFFPEGGSLASGNKTVIGWEVNDLYGQPMQVSGILYRDNKPVDTIQTNGYGMGRFALTVETDVKYYVKLVLSQQPSPEYILPQNSLQNISITVSNAVCNDTLRFRAADLEQGMYYGMIHNYAEHFFSFPIDLRKLNTVGFRVPLTEVPRGINTITILDSMGRPVAERLFFAHYDQRTEMIVKTDQRTYTTRQKVTLNLQLKDPEGEDVKGVVSVACVQDNRFDVYKMTDIESYTFLNNQLAHLPFKKNPMEASEDNLQYWEDVLLIKGWRRYTWPELMQSGAQDTASQLSDVLFKGDLALISTRNIRKPVEMSMIADNKAALFNTDSTGNFLLKREALITPPGKQVLLFVNGKAKEDYTINIKDPYQEISKKMGKALVFENFDVAATEKSSENMVLKKGEKAEVLQEVIVNSKKERDVFVATGRKNECGDYVCSYGVLNCVNHPFGGTLPVAGTMYRSAFGMARYPGCTDEDKRTLLKGLKGIYTAKAFYNIDYTKMDPNEIVYLSTVLWNYAVPVRTDKPAELSFFLSDIPGKYRVVVQGVTENGVVHGEQVFVVTRKEQ